MRARSPGVKIPHPGRKATNFSGTAVVFCVSGIVPHKARRQNTANIYARVI